MELKSRIGETVGPYHDDVQAEHVEKFRKAVGAHATDAVPPTFLTICRKGEFDLLQRLGIPLARVLHGEQEYVYHRPLEVGSRLTYETKLIQALEKKGSASILQIVTFETDVRDSVGTVATSRTTIIYRGAAQ